MSKLPERAPCVSSFDSFAYTIPSITEQRTQVILPGDPWEVVSKLPDVRQFGELTVEATRIANNRSEIWISNRGLYTSFFTEVEARSFLFIVYRLDTKDWNSISPHVVGTDLYVDRLFVESNGRIWGRNVWPENEDLTEQPLLSRFNEESGFFEPDNITSAIPNGIDPDGANRFPTWDKIVLSRDGIFWIFVYKDGIYSYDPQTQGIKKHASLAEFDTIFELAPSPDGSIYFTSFGAKDPAFFENGLLFHFVPETGRIDAVEGPRQLWPSFWNILVDRSDRLWLDANGWREPDGKWYLLRSNMLDYWWNEKIYEISTWYSQPQIFLQTTDGRLWFKVMKTGDNAYYIPNTGMAWLDPQTMEGCWFTTETANIVEDQQQNLWMVMNGNLYMAPLKP